MMECEGKMNRVIIIGEIEDGAELKEMQSGKPVCFFSLAVSHKTKLREETDRIDCVAWDDLAQRIAGKMAGGQRVALEGRLHSREYVTAKGAAKKVTEVVAKSIEFLDKASLAKASGAL